jgi:hypothetical protein
MENYVKDNKEFIERWIKWLDSDIRMRVISDWDKQNKKELKEFLEGLLK